MGWLFLARFLGGCRRQGEVVACLRWDGWISCWSKCDLNFFGVQDVASTLSAADPPTLALDFGKTRPAAAQP